MLVLSTISINVRIGPPLTVHAGIALPAPAIIPFMPHIEVPHTMFWGPGQSFTTTVKFDGFTVGQQGSDSGIGIIHISIPITNPLLPLTIATSAFKSLFGASTVQVQGKPAAGFFPFLAPKLACAAPVSWPLGVFIPFPNTVWVGMTFLDFVFGWAACLLTMGIEAIMGKFFGKIPFIKNLGAKFGSRLASRVASEAAQAAAKHYAKSLVGDFFKGLIVSPIVAGKIALPFQIAEWNLWTGKTKFLYWEGPRLYEGADREYGSVMGGLGWANSAAQAPDTGGDPTAGAADGLPTVP